MTLENELQEIITDALQILPPLNRKLIEASYLDGDSALKLMRAHGLTRKELTAFMEQSLRQLNAYLRHRGIESVADVL